MIMPVWPRDGIERIPIKDYGHMMMDWSIQDYVVYTIIWTPDILP